MTEQNKTKHRFSILVVDDEPANIDILLGILGPFYDVKVAPSGAIALKITQQFTPDLILLDIMMPGMNGIDLALELRESRPDLQVIYMSGYTGEMVARAGKLHSEVIQPDRCVYWGLPTGLHQLTWYFSTLNQMNRSPVRQLDG